MPLIRKRSLRRDALPLVTHYQRQMRDAVARQEADSQIADTVCGLIEYAVTGGDEPEKLPVLIAHSSMGGYDQSLATGRRFRGHPIVAVSRAGYLRTPLSTGLTPAAMADAYAALLDVLRIPEVIMVGFSAGGMSAVEFAIRHPSRCRALVLGAAVTRTLPVYVLKVFAPLATAVRSDFANWLISGGVRTLALPLMERDPETRDILRAFQMTNPASRRFPGYELDIARMHDFQPRLAQIKAPTLLIHGDMDFLVPVSHAREAARTIPGAQLLVIKGGQHDCPVRYPAVVLPALEKFLSDAAGSPSYAD